MRSLCRPGCERRKSTHTRIQRFVQSDQTRERESPVSPVQSIKSGCSPTPPPPLFLSLSFFFRLRNLTSGASQPSSTHTGHAGASSGLGHCECVRVCERVCVWACTTLAPRPLTLVSW